MEVSRRSKWLKELRLLFVTHRFSPFVGGVESFVKYLAKEMYRRGHEVRVISLIPFLSSQHTEFNSQTEDGIEVFRFWGISPSNAYHIPFFRFVHRLREKADVVHVQCLHSLVVPFSYFIKKMGVEWGRFVISTHYHRTGHSWHARVMWSVYRPLIRKFLSSAAAIHAVSEFEASLLKEDFGVCPIVIPPGIRADVISCSLKKPDHTRVICVGRQEKYKRTGLVLRAFPYIQQRDREAELVIVGEGQHVKNLKKLAKHLNVKVSFKGFLPRHTYLDELSKSTCFVNLSEKEAYSISVAEALALGLPAVVVEPWGRNFGSCSGAIVLRQNPSLREIADAILSCNSNRGSKPTFPTWREVALTIENRLYATPG
jgi:glycosyltransferase involved in cell wall biosynthesis